MLGKLFNRNKSAQTNLYDFRERLGLHDYLQHDEKAHMRVLVSLMKFKKQTIEYKGRGQSYFINPDQKVIPQINIPGEAPTPVRSSANICYTEDKLENGQWSFAMTIDQSSETYADMKNRMIFGLYGLFDRETGNMEVLTILAPDMDKDGNFSKMIKVPLNEWDLELATLYAENCAKEIFEKRSPDPIECLNKAVERHLAKEKSADNSPAP